MSKKEYMRQYMNERFRQKVEYYKSILGGVCVICNSQENLEFDHIDPKEKIFSISKIWNQKDSIVLKELKKCQLLCKNCHLEKTSLYNSINMEGSRNHNSKLTKEKVLHIRTKEFSQSEFAKIYNVSKSVISKVQNFLSYKNITDDVILFDKTKYKKENNFHGTKNGYDYHKCRCDLCTIANREHSKKYYKRIDK